MSQKSDHRDQFPTVPKSPRHIDKGNGERLGTWAWGQGKHLLWGAVGSEVHRLAFGELVIFRDRDFMAWGVTGCPS